MKKRIITLVVVIVLNLFLFSCTSENTDIYSSETVDSNSSEKEISEDIESEEVENEEIEKSHYEENVEDFTNSDEVIDFDPQVVKEVLDIDISGEYVYVPQVCDFEVPVEIADLGGEHIGELYEEPFVIQRALTELYLYSATEYSDYFDKKMESILKSLSYATDDDLEIIDYRVNFYTMKYPYATVSVKDQDDSNVYFFDDCMALRILDRNLLIDRYYFQRDRYEKTKNKVEDLAEKYFDNVTVDFYAIDTSRSIITIYCFTDESIDYSSQQMKILEMINEYGDDKAKAIRWAVVYLDTKYENILTNPEHFDSDFHCVDWYQCLYDRQIINDCFIGIVDEYESESVFYIPLNEIDNTHIKMPNWLN